jgi:DNA-binding XRE family transcriptional regulator
MEDRAYNVGQCRALAGNLTRVEAAKLLGVCVNTYKKMEKHPEKLTLKQAYIIANAAEIKITQIMV